MTETLLAELDRLRVENRARMTETLLAELDRLRVENNHLRKAREALETLLRFTREVDVQAALHQGGVDVRAALGSKEGEDG